MASVWPPSPPSWLLPWTIWRFKYPTPRPPRTDGGPKEIPPWAWGWLKWVEWTRNGRIPPRPVSTPKAPIPDKIPQWGWNLYKQLLVAVPKKPPPPPPPTYVNSWKLPWPLVFTAWGPVTDWRTTADFDVFCQRCVAAKVRTVVMQIGQFLPWQPDRLRGWGLKVALWGLPQAIDQQALQDAKAEGYMPQIEGPYQYLTAVDNLAKGYGHGLSISTVTTLAGIETFTTRPDGAMTTIEAEKLISLGCTHALVECYRQDGDGKTHFPISKMMWSAQHRGIPYADPIIGLYWDVPVSTYQPDLAAHGTRVGAYTSETMRPVDWQDFGKLGQLSLRSPLRALQRAVRRSRFAEDLMGASSKPMMYRYEDRW